MNDNNRSFERVNYIIRPSKQVERKLFIESLHYLSQNADYKIREYSYIGLGSVYYADFILFHKYLYLDDMICVEKEEIEDRMEFNKPYNFIELHMCSISNLLPIINFNEKKYIVWLDYDYSPDDEMLSDISLFARKLKAGSILIVTVDADLKLPDREENEKYSKIEREEKLLILIKGMLQSLVECEIDKSLITRNDLPRIYSDALVSQIKTSLAGRSDSVEFFQLYNYQYADGAQMLTIGGIIDYGTKKIELEKSGIYKLTFIVKESQPRLISVPPLTFREKEKIDCYIKKNPNWEEIKKQLPFELDDKLLKNYLQYYRHYPSYHEIVI